MHPYMGTLPPIYRSEDAPYISTGIYLPWLYSFSLAISLSLSLSLCIYIHTKLKETQLRAQTQQKPHSNSTQTQLNFPIPSRLNCGVGEYLCMPSELHWPRWCSRWCPQWCLDDVLDVLDAGLTWPDLTWPHRHCHWQDHHPLQSQYHCNPMHAQSIYVKFEGGCETHVILTPGPCGRGSELHFMTPLRWDQRDRRTGMWKLYLISGCSIWSNMFLSIMAQAVRDILYLTLIMKQGDYVYHYKTWRYGRVLKVNGDRISIEFAPWNFDYKKSCWRRDGHKRKSRIMRVA